MGGKKTGKKGSRKSKEEPQKFLPMPDWPKLSEYGRVLRGREGKLIFFIISSFATKITVSLEA